MHVITDVTLSQLLSRFSAVDMNLSGSLCCSPQVTPVFVERNREERGGCCSECDGALMHKLHTVMPVIMLLKQRHSV